MPCAEHATNSSSVAIRALKLTYLDTHYIRHLAYLYRYISRDQGACPHAHPALSSLNFSSLVLLGSNSATSTIAFRDYKTNLDQFARRFFCKYLGCLEICKQGLNFASLPSSNTVTLRSIITSGLIKGPSPLKNSLETLRIESRE